MIRLILKSIVSCFVSLMFATPAAAAIFLCEDEIQIESGLDRLIGQSFTKITYTVKRSLEPWLPKNPSPIEITIPQKEVIRINKVLKRNPEKKQFVEAFIERLESIRTHMRHHKALYAFFVSKIVVGLKTHDFLSDENLPQELADAFASANHTKQTDPLISFLNEALNYAEREGDFRAALGRALLFEQAGAIYQLNWHRINILRRLIIPEHLSVAS